VTNFFDGFVLRGAKTSQTNATTTAPADSGVARDVVAPSSTIYPSGSPGLVEARADQYRSAVLNSVLGEQEFLVWAANTGSVTTLEGPDWVVDDGQGAIPKGGLSVFNPASPSGLSTDGSPRIVVTDNGGRDIAGIVAIEVKRGGSSLTYTLIGGDFSFVPGSGVLTLLPTANTLAVTNPVAGPALSQSRGDSVVSVLYWVSAARFWWTRNDSYSTRFGWNGATQKWEPYRGGAPINLGKLSSSGVRYVLSPRPTTPVGSLLPGNTGDSYASIRLGSSPNASSYAVVERTVGDFSGILVVEDDLANSSYNFASSSPPLAGVMGRAAGEIVWNPAFIQAYEGFEVWYNPRTFLEKSSGVVGSLLSAKTRSLFLAPVPSLGERPIIRLGNRQPLTALPFDTETELLAAVISEGEVGFSISTGRIRLSSADISKADPGTRLAPNPSFDKGYLGALVRYDGVSLNLYPQPLKAPVLLVDSTGTPVTSYDPSVEVFIPDGGALPGLGSSGILNVPDGVGNPPVVGAVSPRPGSSGLVRRLSSGIGDVLLFTQGRTVTSVVPISFEDELPTDPYRVPGDTAYVSLQKRTGAGSLVFFGSVPRKDLAGLPVYFRQAEFVPSSYATRSRLISRVQDTFVLDGSEVFRFRLGATSVVWLASALGAGTFSATIIAASIQARIALAGAPGSCTQISGRVVISHTSSGLVSIGFELSGCAALGFVPGWLTSPSGDFSATDPNWIADYGGEFGFYRSPRDLDGSQPIPDVRDKYRLESRTLTGNISPVTFQFLDFAPREDIAGYDEGVFFALSAAGAPGASPIVARPLQPWEDVKYLFEEKKFAWVSSSGSTLQVQSPVAGVNLGVAGVLPESLIAPLNGFLKVSADGGPFSYLEPGVDFILVGGGTTGEAILVDQVGARFLEGSRGRFPVGSILTDVSVDFLALGVSTGDRLKIISGGDQGSYTVETVNVTSLQVSPPFLVGDEGVNVSYEVFRGVSPGLVDPAVVADVLYEEFDHLAEEPFEIRVLTNQGIGGGVLVSADAAKSIEQKRPIFVRVGQIGLDIPLRILSRKNLGVVSNGVLFVPNSGVRFTSGAFDLRIGSTLFVQGVGLLPVASFSINPVFVEYLTTTGELKFGSGVLAEYQSASVQYVETLLAGSDLASGDAEIDPDTGDLAVSAADLIVGDPIYFVEQLSVEGTTDCVVNPILGTFTFLANPIRPYQLVEVTYYRANPSTGALYLDSDNNPVRIREFLPLYIRAEVATRISSQLYSFNPTGRTADPLVSPVVYTGSKQQTYGLPLGCSVDFTRNTISLNEEVVAGTKVTISYAVFEAFGGETSYTVSAPPVWRPPFSLAKGQTSFLLDSDRTSDVVAGKALRVGAFTTYVTSSVYDALSDTTEVTVFPPTNYGAGSLNPGQNALSLISNLPIDSSFLPTLAEALGLPNTPKFEPVTQGQVEIKIEGNLTRYTVAGHLLELFGHPFAIVKGGLSSDGRTTTITVASPFPSTFEWSSTMLDSDAKISARPIYPSGATQFLGVSPFLPTEPFEVILFGELSEGGDPLPGRTLVSGKDYNATSGNGSLAFISPRQGGVRSTQKLVFSRTDTRTLSPFASKGALQYPRVSSGFLFVDPPSKQNGREGGLLQGTYTFESPDSFFVQAKSFKSYVGDVALEIQKQATASEPSLGPTLSTGEVKSNGDFGRVGISSERSNLIDKDRAARAFLGFFNSTISSFEQITETLSGELVGEKDGKLRLYVGKDDPWTPPGYEDQITGALNPRVLWFDAWTSARSGLPMIQLLTTDPVTDPLNTQVDSNGRPFGAYQDPSSFSALTGYQEILVKNDIDDVVLTTRIRTERKLSGFITFRVLSFGQFSDLSQASPFSRLFPEKTMGFTTLSPGLDGDEATGAPGVYSAGKLGLDPLGFLFGAPFSLRSTTGTTIGQLENPVLGQIQNVLGVQARDRRARARVWAYSPTGFPEVDALSSGRPSIIATPLSLVEFPILSDTGLPDTTQLASESGGPLPTGLNDLLTGSPELHTPPFAPGMQLAVGSPDGSSTELGYAGTTFPVGPESRYAGVFVDAVLKGCVITLKSKDISGADVPILDALLLLSLSSPTNGSVLNPSRGDTVFAIPGTGSVLPVTSDPPTIAELQAFTSTTPTYRTGTDLNFTARTGELTDATLPSFSDPTLFGLKEITGQHPPAPLSTLEAVVSFQNGSRLPVLFPGLKGEKTLDSGDYSLPYYGSPTNELEILGSAASLISTLVRSDSPNPPPVAPPSVPAYFTEAVFPDETLGSAGRVQTTPPSERSTLTTFEDLFRGTSSGAYPPPPGHAGVGDVNPYDLLLIQAPTGVPGVAGFPLGSTGVHSIARIQPGAPNQIDLPRFVTPVNGNLTYQVDHGIAWVAYPLYGSGIVVQEDTTLSPDETIFDLSSVGSSSIVLDDGSGGGLLPVPVGGLNDVFGTNDKGSVLWIRLINKATGQFVPGSTVRVEKISTGADILTSVFEVSGDNGVTAVPVTPGGFYFLPDRVVIKTNTPFFNFGPYNPVVGPPGTTTTSGFHDFTFSVLSNISEFATINSDRVTFQDRIDFRSALPRGFVHPFPGGSLMECQLSTRFFGATLFDTTTATLVARSNLVNDIDNINDGLPFTLPTRNLTPSVNGVGTWAAGVGSLRVLGFEGQGNIPIDATDITFTAIPSSRQDGVGPILNGTFFVGELQGPGAPFSIVGENVFIPITTHTGSLGRVQPGDVAIMKGVYDPFLVLSAPVGSGKVGTYLVRAAVESTPLDLPGHRLDLTVSVGDAGWFDFRFPTVVSMVGSDLTVSSLLPLSPLQDLNAAPVASSFAFPSSGRVFLILNESLVGSAGSAVSAAYSSLDGPGSRFLGLSGFQDAVGNPITLTAFQNAAAFGVRVSGMTILPVNVWQEGSVAQNLPGYTVWPSPPLGTEFYFGFREVTASRSSFGSVTYDAGIATLVGVPPGPAQISVYSKVKVASTSFLQLDEPVYDNIPGGLDLSNFSWTTIHGAGPACLYPNDIFELRYHAQNGLFVEPSFPVSGNDLAATRVNVVDAGHSLLTSEIGTRNISSYISGVGPSGGSLLEVGQVEVRRIRRFHDSFGALADSLRDLRFVYEIRRGIVQTFTGSGSTGVLVAQPVDTQNPPQPLVGGRATQLGDFTNSNIGIRAGDSVRFLSNLSGEVVAVAEVLVVETGRTLTLSKNALNLVGPGTRFEIYLRSAPVPHEQSCAELLELATDRILLDRPADLITQVGGSVAYVADVDPQVAYDQSVNILTDTLDFGALGIQQGDILVVDPAGPLRGPTGFAPTPERGVRPFGDTSVLPRGAPTYVPGSPHRIDDNRGYYKVLTVTPTTLGVVPLGGVLAGNRTSADAIIDGQYAVYPTVHGSLLSGGLEGQMDLRPTGYADGTNSFASNWLSIAPFAYKVIRPTTFLTEETVELILATRERMLSWMEELRGIFEAEKSGSYFVFQRDEHIADLGDTSDPLDGLGVLFDAYIAGLEGLVRESPFANSSDCLSILDRRFWGLDFRLDYLRPPFSPLDPPYADFENGVGRPTLPDRIEEALEQRDQLRNSRWAWLTVRTDRVSGTLASIRRFDEEAPRRKAEQQRLLTLVKGTEKV